MPCGPLARLTVLLDGAAAPTLLSAARRSEVVDVSPALVVDVLFVADLDDDPPQAAAMKATAPNRTTNVLDARMRRNVVVILYVVVAPILSLRSEHNRRRHLAVVIIAPDVPRQRALWRYGARRDVDEHVEGRGVGPPLHGGDLAADALVRIPVVLVVAAGPELAHFFAVAVGVDVPATQGAPRRADCAAGEGQRCRT